MFLVQLEYCIEVVEPVDLILKTSTPWSPLWFVVAVPTTEVDSVLHEHGANRKAEERA
jgi:hypothetical protein